MFDQGGCQLKTNYCSKYMYISTRVLHFSALVMAIEVVPSPCNLSLCGLGYKNKSHIAVRTNKITHICFCNFSNGISAGKKKQFLQDGNTDCTSGHMHMNDYCVKYSSSSLL